MVSLYFVYYNFVRVHQTIRVTPAMEAGIADHVWSIEEIVGLLTLIRRTTFGEVHPERYWRRDGDTRTGVIRLWHHGDYMGRNKHAIRHVRLLLRAKARDDCRSGVDGRRPLDTVTIVKLTEHRGGRTRT